VSYSKPSDSYIARQVNAIQTLFTDYVNRHGTSFIDNVNIDIPALSDCVSRVHQREHYYKTFHNMPAGISEVKKISLYSFWIMKYSPFILRFNIPKTSPEVEAFWKWRAKYFVERFCVYLFTMTIRVVYKNKSVTRLPLSDAGIKDLVYSFRHHDVSKESLTAMFEILEDVVKQKPAKKP
jgi:hypothetical protein